jgi:hypothetical protein
MKFRLTQAARRQTNFRTIQWRRNCVGTSQDHDADGGVALQNAARRAEGTDGGAIVYSLVRMVMCQSAVLQHLAVERISFLDALRWLGAPSSGVPLGALIVNPIRPHLVEWRVKKRRSKNFPLVIKRRQEVRQDTFTAAPFEKCYKRRDLHARVPAGTTALVGPSCRV